MKLIEQFLARFRDRHPDSQAVEEFKAEQDELLARLEAKLDDDRVRQKITEARVRNFRRLP